MHEKYSLSVQVRASKRLANDNQESSNCHNHACDKTKLIGHKNDTRALRQSKSSRLN
jgi:hypothetical protein